MAAGEWDHAARVDVSLPYPEGLRSGTVLVMNDGTNLYLALVVNRPLLGNDGPEFHFDNRHDGNNEARGNDFLRLIPSFRAEDMYFDPSTRLYYADPRDGGSEEVAGVVRNDGSRSVFELSHPLDTADDAHDFSLGPGARVGFAFSFSDCFCAGEHRMFWPATGPWADIAIARALPTLALSAVTLTARWRESLLDASTIDFSGTTTDGASLLAELVPAAGGNALASTSLTAGPGPFDGRIGLPADLLPGAYLLRLTGASDQYPLAEQRQAVTLPAPREGIVRRVDVSASKNGPPIGPDDSLPAGAHQLVVRFHFAVMPKQTCSHDVCKPRMTATTYSPGDTRHFTKRLKRARVVVAGVGSSAALASGTWKVVLRVGGIPVRTALVRIG
jgi:hypothetical protein